MHFFARDSKKFVKLIFSARNGENLAKRSYEPTMEQDTVLKKDLYSMSRFDAKRIFKGQMVKILKNAVFNPQWRKTQFSKKSCIP